MIALLLATSTGFLAGCGKSPNGQLPQVELASEGKRPEEVAKPRLAKAEYESQRAIEDEILALNGFFAEAKKRTHGFAADALGWGSKFRLIQDALPFTRNDRHKEFLKGKFEESVFKPEQLEEAVKQVVKGYLTRVRSIEGRMLVELRIDAGDLPASSLLEQDDRQLQASYDSALAKAIEESGAKVQDDVAAGIASTVAGEVLTQVALRLGVRAGILGAGAASGALTLGVGLVVSVILDQIVSFVWDWFADPKGNLANEINRQLDEMNRLLVDGSTDVKGLRERLRESARERAGIRKTIVLRLLQPVEGGRK